MNHTNKINLENTESKMTVASIRQMMMTCEKVIEVHTHATCKLELSGGQCEFEPDGSEAQWLFYDSYEWTISMHVMTFTWISGEE